MAGDRFGDGIIRVTASCVRCHSTDGGTAGASRRSRICNTRSTARASSLTIRPCCRRSWRTTIRPHGQAGREPGEDHHDAVVSVCGTRPGRSGSRFYRGVFSTYRDSDVTVSVAAREVGMPPVEFTEVMQASGNPTIRVLLLGQPISRGQWEPIYHECILLAERWRDCMASTAKNRKYELVFRRSFWRGRGNTRDDLHGPR